MKPRYQNKQLYAECQLVSALNASYKLGWPFIQMGSNEYERLVDFTGGRHGSCIGVNKVYQYLKIEYFDIKPEWDSIRLMLNQGSPVQLGVWTKKTGFHSVCIVDVKRDNKQGGYKFRVPNLRYYTDKQMWVHESFLKTVIDVRPNIGPEYGFYRVFLKDGLYKDK